FDGVGGASAEVDADLDGELVGQCQGVDGAVESAFHQHGWVDAADQVAEFGEGLAGGFSGFGEHGAGGVGVVGDDLFCHAQVHAQGDQACLGAVVEVAFDAADFGCLGVDGVGAAGGQVAYAGGEAGFFAGGQQEAVEAEVKGQCVGGEEVGEVDEEGVQGQGEQVGQGVVVGEEVDGLGDGVGEEAGGDGQDEQAGYGGNEPQEVFPCGGVGDDGGAAAGDAFVGDGAVGAEDGALGW